MHLLKVNIIMRLKFHDVSYLNPKADSHFSVLLNKTPPRNLRISMYLFSEKVQDLESGAHDLMLKTFTVIEL